MKAKDKKGLIFKSREGTPIDPGKFVSRKFLPIVEEARQKAVEEKDDAAAEGFANLHFHDLRHTFGSLKISQG